MSVLTASDRERIISIACRLVEGQVEAGKLNPDDAEALKKATKEAVQTARAAYFAALEYISG